MLPTHQHVEAYRAHEIYRRQPGFEFTPVMLGKVASFIVRAEDGRIAVCAFMYSLLAALDGEVDEDALLAEAVRVIERRIDAGEVGPRRDITFEYHDGVWVEVGSPRWWIPTSG